MTSEEPMTVALVTGASRGIGRATAVQLAREGHDIAIGYGRDATAAERVAEEVRALGRRAAVAGGDLAHPETSGALVDAAERQLGPVDVLVANAGIAGRPAALADIGVADWDRMQAINLRAPFLLAQRVLPGMVERGFGRTVLVSSIAAYTGGVVGAHYAASKAGLHGLAHSLSRQGAGHGVTVNVVAPAAIDSDMLSDEQTRARLLAATPLGRLGTAEEVADVIAAVVRNGYLTGQSLLLDGGRYPT
ncbi:SDR family NAD(P)-dependent oxidoreductase [Marinactinospora rubrisoli]|uniref:SDR family NAD(P)-dependent oxidoreductase n=1 Tax=Marinactinospora rubrisoli TaxID=2715399 RepID=A0ABW2KDN6_9ACTN